MPNQLPLGTTLTTDEPRRRIQRNAQVRRLVRAMLDASEAASPLQRWRVAAHLTMALGLPNTANGRRAVRRRMMAVEALIAREHRRVLLVATSADQNWRDVKGTGAMDGNGRRVNVAWKIHRAEDAADDFPYLVRRLTRRSQHATKALTAADTIADVMSETDAEVDRLTIEVLEGMRADVAIHARGTLKQYDLLIRRLRRSLPPELSGE